MLVTATLNFMVKGILTFLALSAATLIISYLFRNKDLDDVVE